VLGRVSGDLSRSIVYRVIGNRVTVGTNLPYGRIHEYGSTGRRRMPARPYLSTALRDSQGAIKSIVQRLCEEALREAMK